MTDIYFPSVFMECITIFLIFLTVLYFSGGSSGSLLSLRLGESEDGMGWSSSYLYVSMYCSCIYVCIDCSFLINVYIKKADAIR